MVLARIEGDPPGTKGLSLFIVPKIRIEAEELIFNDVVCTGIEEKMGCHGSATCTLSFGEEDRCVGYLLGEKGDGIRVMFHMMNEARQIVGSQGLAQGSAAYLSALAYARERIQGVHFTRSRDPQAPGVPIIEHPDIRYTLMKMKSHVEGCRSLVYYHAHLMDRMASAANEEETRRLQERIELLTPVCKAFVSDRGYEICTSAVQVMGGYGYSSEFDVEQRLRDEKIATIYEGTNGIQALDLVIRKIRMKQGRALEDLLGEMRETVGKALSIQGLSGLAAPLDTYVSKLEEATQILLEEMEAQAGTALAKAGRYLDFLGSVTLGWMWLQQMIVAKAAIQARETQSTLSDAEAVFYEGKLGTGAFFLERMLPAAEGAFAEIVSRGNDFTEMPVASL